MKWWVFTVLGSAALGIAVALSVAQLGCNPANDAAIADAGVCVYAGAQAGLSVAQIASKCATDVATVLTTLASSTDAKVQASPAYAETLKAKAALGAH